MTILYVDSRGRRFCQERVRTTAAQLCWGCKKTGRDHAGQFLVRYFWYAPARARRRENRPELFCGISCWRWYWGVPQDARGDRAYRRGLYPVHPAR